MKIGRLLIFILSLFIMNPLFMQVLESDSFLSMNAEEIGIHFIKHASFYITYEETTLYSDPVNYEGIDYKMLPKADVILITHEHYDHLDKNAIADISTPNTVIFCNESVHNILGTGIVLQNGVHVNYIIDIEAVPAYNTSAGRDIYHPKNRDNGYIITLGGSRIYISGDSENMPEMAQLKNIDAAFFSINQPYTMTVDQAISAAKIIKPKILYPIHYSDTNLEKLSTLAKEGIDVRIFKM